MTEQQIQAKRIKELEGEFTTDVDVIEELEKQYEAAKSQGHGQTALKALELLSRVRGNNAEDEGPDDLDSLEGEIKKSIWNKAKNLFLSTLTY